MKIANSAKISRVFSASGQRSNGTADDWKLNESVTWDSTDFSTPSFTASDNGMSGGVNPTGVIYSYAIPLTGGYDLNGNLLQVTDSVMGTWSYTYDNLNRLITAQAPTGTYANVAMSWNLDPWGNRLAENEGEISTSNPAPTVAMPTASNATYNTSNQIVTASANLGGPFTYDAAGDVIFDGTNSYAYDAEGRLCAVKNSTGYKGYIYDAAGIRVAMVAIGSLACNWSSTANYKVYTSWALGQGGEQVAEFTPTNWKHSNVFAGGKLIGTYDTVGLHFYLDDWLGTRRIQTNSTGQLEMTCQSLPYGNGQNCPTTSLTTADNPTEQFFTGKERDAESGNDYFGARYYNSAAGRFLSPDWSAKEEPVPYAKMDDPQTLNLYDYVRNNPMTGVDADGHCDWCQKLMNGLEGNGLRTDAQVKALKTPPPPPPLPKPPPVPPPPPLQFKPNVPVPTPDSGLGKLLQCTNSCMNPVPIGVSSTSETVPGHPEIHGPDTPHGRGEAADLTPGKSDAKSTLWCAAQCGAGFGQNEYDHPSAHATGGHDHVQTGEGKGGGRGDLPPNEHPAQPKE